MQRSIQTFLTTLVKMGGNVLQIADGGDLESQIYQTLINLI
jgi:hypothetical protein